MNKISRLKKMNKSIMLGNIIDSNYALQLIQQNFGDKYSRSKLMTDVSGEESILGLISDDNKIAAELYCFKQEDGMYKGFVIGAIINVINAESQDYQLQNYECICLNPTLNDNMNISQLRQQFKNGVDICNMHVTFQNNNMDIFNQ